MDGPGDELGGGRGQADDLLRLCSTLVRPVPYLTGAVVSPAQHPVTADAARMITAGREGLESGRHVCGNETIHASAVSELSVAVRSPAKRVAVGRESCSASDVSWLALTRWSSVGSTGVGCARHSKGPVPG